MVSSLEILTLFLSTLGIYLQGEIAYDCIQFTVVMAKYLANGLLGTIVPIPELLEDLCPREVLP